jgi:RIO-like serine/threonine protein kinase
MRAGGTAVMAATFGNHIAPESLRLMLLAYGMDHAYRVVSLEEIAHSIPHVRRDEVRDVLENLAQEGLVTRFSGRYCFNKTIPIELRQNIEQLITPSGTIRKRTN